MRRCRVVGKVQYHSLEQAAGAARYSARVANARRELSQTMYAYRCGWCRKIHVTRDPTHEELTNVVVFVAPPEALQRWAFPARSGTLGAPGHGGKP